MLFAPSAKAESTPDAGAIFREIQRATPKLEKPAGPAQPLVPPSEAVPLKDGRSFVLSDVRIRSTLFPEAVLREVIADRIGRETTLGDLDEMMAAIGRYYRDRGYLARVYLPQQVIRDGIVEIVVLEGRLGKVVVDPQAPSRLSPDLAVGTVLWQQDGDGYIRLDSIGDGVANLNSLPGISAQAIMVPGGKEGESDVVLTIRDTPLLQGGVILDNANARAIGRWRAVALANLNDPLGWGDQLSLTAMRSAGAKYARVAVQAPVSYSGLTVGINASALDFSTDKDVNTTQPGGNATTQGATAVHPLFRSENSVFQVNASFDHKRLVNDVSFETISENHVYIGGLGVSGSARDTLLGRSGTTSVGVTASLGRLDLSANEENQSSDESSARTRGTFGKLAANVGRDQPLTDDTSLALTLSGQWASKNLDSSEKFSLGGPSGIRAYPVNEASGDRGWLASAELRHSVTEDVRGALFYDFGRIEQHARKWNDWQGGGDQPNSYLLHGIGAWVSWSPLQFLTIKGTLAQVIDDNPGRTTDGYDNDGTRSRTRFWLQATATF